METARDQHTGRILTVDAYGRLDPARRSQLDLVCEGTLPSGSPCAAPAYFRRRSVDGRRPCFFSTAHGEGCTSSSMLSEDTPGDHGHAVQARTASAALLTLRVDPPAPSTGPDGRRRPDDETPGEVTTRHTTRPSRVVEGTGAATRRLRTVLADLVAGELDPGIRIRVDGSAPILAAEFFVHMTSTDPDLHDKRTRGYWGRIRRCERNSSTGSLMLYADGVRNPPLKVVLTTQQTLALDLAEARWPLLVGRYMLAVGTYRLARNGSPYITIPDAWHLGLLQAPKRP